MALTKGMIFCPAFNLSRKVKEFHLILEYAYTYKLSVYIACIVIKTWKISMV